MYASLHLPERDVCRLNVNASGEPRLFSKPDRSIGFVVESIVPAAQVKGQRGSQFWVRMRLTEARRRPDRSGKAKIDAGRKSIAWLLTHWLVDLVSMKLWS